MRGRGTELDLRVQPPGELGPLQIEPNKGDAKQAEAGPR